MSSIARENALICLGCWDQMHMPIPIKGPLAWPFRAFGIRRSKMNPNICTICERSFRYVKKKQQITAEATILFADIRGFTRFSERADAAAVSRVVNLFHDQCAQAIWAENGIVNKQMGDGLMAIFNFPIRIERHAAAAVRAALDIQRRCSKAFESTPPDDLQGVGVGVHTGQVEIGEFSSFHSDFTAIGGAVNLAARLESQASPGEVMISSEAARLAPEIVSTASRRALRLKGIEQPVEARVLTA